MLLLRHTALESEDEEAAVDTAYAWLENSQWWDLLGRFEEKLKVWVGGQSDPEIVFGLVTWGGGVRPLPWGLVSGQWVPPGGVPLFFSVPSKSKSPQLNAFFKKALGRSGRHSVLGHNFFCLSFRRMAQPAPFVKLSCCCPGQFPHVASSDRFLF